MGGTLGQAHTGQRSQGPLAPLGSLNARVQHGQLHVFQGAGARQQVELLEHKTDTPVADRGQLVFRHGLHLLPGQLVLACGGQVQTTQNIHQGRFARPRGAHDGHKITLNDVERYAAQRMHGLVPHGVGFGQRLRLDQRRSSMGRRLLGWPGRGEIHQAAPIKTADVGQRLRRRAQRQC